MDFKILPSGFRDLAESRDFYDQRDPGLGSYFLESLFSDIESLRIYAGIHRKVFGYHRLLARRFPFAIYYRMEGKIAVVCRILDCRRDPKKIRDALR